MEPGFSSLLYTRPWLYEIVFPDAEETVVGMCRAAFARYLEVPPRSVVDFGCGTGRHLQALARTIPEAWGVDLLESNIGYARERRPALTWQVGDMRTARLGRTFDAVTCFGNAISYLLADDDLRGGVATFAAHAHPGTLLLLDALNASCYLDGDGFRERIEGRVQHPEFTADSVSVHALDRTARILRRTRTWTIPGQRDIVDRAAYRLLYPEEARHLLEAGGFEVVGLYDNRQFRSSDLTGTISSGPDVGGMRGRKLFAFARRR